MSQARGSGGVFLAVVGQSGVGKDSLIAHARTVYAGNRDILFVKRVITREADIAAEDHDTMDAAGFEQARAAGRFLVTWEAHGLQYGIPAGVHDHVLSGGVAVANCSRNALAELRDKLPAMVVVNVTARPEVIERRLTMRGRETASEIEKRFARRIEDFAGRDGAVEIDNSGRIEDACAVFVRLIAEKAGTVQA